MVNYSKIQFQIEEHYYKYSPWLKVWEFIRGILTVFYLPLAYGKHLIDKVRGIKEPDSRPQNVCLEHVEYDTYKVQSLALSNEDFTKIFEAETLDFPDWRDWDDPFRFLLKFRTQPELKELENAFFDEIDLKTEIGIFLIRINKKGNGMTLCFLPSDEETLIEVAPLKPLSWTITKREDGNIELLGYADKGKQLIEVKLTTTNAKKESAK